MTAPTRRAADRLGAQIPPLAIVAIAVGLHALQLIGEHVTLALVAFGTAPGYLKRLGDARRHAAAEQRRTDEHAAAAGNG